MHRRARHAPALLALALAACAQRRCGAGSSPASATDAAPAPAAALSAAERERCAREIDHAAVAAPPGFGAIDALVPACGADGTLAVWTLRGHTLSRLSRPRAPGSVFSPPEVIATGADRLGPVGPDDALGPVAWRSPTVALDEDDADEWWAGALDPSAPAGARVRRGSTILPRGSVGLGVVAPVRSADGGVELLATVAREGSNPALVLHVVPTGTRGGEPVETLTQDPPALAEGELRAWESARRVGLAFAVTQGGGGELRAVALENGRVVERGRIALAKGHVLVAPRAVAAGDDAVFAYSEFDVGRAEQGGCLAFDESLCVVPGAVTLARVSRTGVTTVVAAPEGLVDAVTLDAHDRAWVLYLARGEPAQRAVRVDLARGTSEPVALRPAGELPPLDHLALVRCGREPWAVAEVLVGGEGEGDAAGGAGGERAVLAAPLACLTGED